MYNGIQVGKVTTVSTLASVDVWFVLGQAQPYLAEVAIIPPKCLRTTYGTHTRISQRKKATGEHMES